jgi:hypothetical protein
VIHTPHRRFSPAALAVLLAACGGGAETQPTIARATASGAPLSSPSDAPRGVLPAASASATPLDGPPRLSGPSPFAKVMANAPFRLWPMEGTLVGEVVRGVYPPDSPDTPKDARSPLNALELDSFWYVLVDRAFVSAGGYVNGSYMWGPRLAFFVGSADAPNDIIALAMQPRGRGNEAFWIDAKGKYHIAPNDLEGGWAGYARWGSSLVGAGYFFGTRYSVIKGPPVNLDDHKDEGLGVANLMGGVFGGTSNGDLFISGHAEMNGGPFAVEVWRHGAKKSEMIEADGKALSLAGGEAYLFGPSVARWDGTHFVDVGPKAPDGTDQIFAVGEGDARVLFALQNGDDDAKPPKPSRLFALDAGVWKTVPAPEGVTKPSYLFDGKHLWLIADGLYQWFPPGGATPAPLHPPDGFLPSDIDVPPRKFEVGGPKCEHNVVVLFGFSKVTPDDYTFPLTRKAVKGHTELSGVSFAVTRRGDQKYFVGLVQDFATASKLAQIITKGVAGSTPQITCDEPEIVRTLDIDLATGEVRRPTQP